jgi:hypothetical protein
MLLVPKIIHAQHYCASNGKMKMKKTIDKSMMSDILRIVAMSSFYYQNPN